MTRARNIWDAVWGQIELTEEEWNLINTPAFQRLRRIHQLAMTMLVFPGATHTRFEHSLGTRHVADRIGRRLVDRRRTPLRRSFRRWLCRPRGGLAAPL